MKTLYSNIMRLMLTIGLSERELFIDKVSALISKKMDADPQRSEHIAESILRMAESLKDELLLRQLFAENHEPASGNQELIDKIDQLNRTLEELNKTLNNKPL